MSCGAVARADHGEGAEGVHHEPPRSDTAVAGTAGEVGDDEGRRTAPWPQILPIAAGGALPSCLEEAPMALQRGDEVEVLIPAGLDHPPPQIVGIQQHQDLDTCGGLALANELGGQLGGRLEGHSHRGTGSLLTYSRMPYGSTGWRKPRMPQPS